MFNASVCSVVSVWEWECAVSGGCESATFKLDVSKKRSKVAQNFE